jgi:glycosyltransferase involved in cell wall biosynthesis
MVKVLQIVGGLRRAGTETWLLQVARRINRSAIAMDFLVHGDEEGDYEEELRDLGFGIVRTPMPGRYAAYLRSVGAAFERGGYDVVHSHLQHFSGVTTFLASRHQIPVRIVHSHLDVQPQLARGRKATYAWVMQRLIRHHATHRVAVSQRAATALFGRDWSRQSNTAVLSCGIDLAPFLGPADMSLRASLGLRPEGLVIGHVGRFVEQKNHEMLLAVAAEVMRKDPDAQLLLVGEGPLHLQIEQTCIELGIRDRTIFAGSRNDVPEILKAAVDVFVFPSRYEGLGLAVVEAQAAGAPCVIADHVPAEVAVLPELIHRQSLQDSPAAWAAAVSRASRSYGGRAAACRVSKTAYNIDCSVMWLERLYIEGDLTSTELAA